jgi:hypothetical protein
VKFFEAINTMLKNNEHLAGWAQFVGAMIALGVTYFTANLPIWAAQRQERERLASLNASAERLLSASAHTVKRAAAMLIIEGYGRENALRVNNVLTGSVEALERFPVHGLADQSSPGSLAVRLGNMTAALRDAEHAVIAHYLALRDETFSLPPKVRQEALENLMSFNVTLTDAIAKGIEPIFVGPGTNHGGEADPAASSPNR